MNKIQWFGGTVVVLILVLSWGAFSRPSPSSKTNLKNRNRFASKVYHFQETLIKPVAVTIQNWFGTEDESEQKPTLTGENLPWIPSTPFSNEPKEVSAKDLNLPDYVMERLNQENEIVGVEEPPSSDSPNRRKSRSEIEEGLNISRTVPLSGPETFSYRPIQFLPGLTKSGKPIQINPDMGDIASRVIGPPDYSLASKIPQYTKLLSLGNGGVIILEVVRGVIEDREGPDFAVFENPFVFKRPDGGLGVYAETAVVSVAEVNDFTKFKMFPCNSTAAPYRGCAGVKPVRYSPQVPITDVGGDLFDLSDVGLSHIKYIRIEDTGDNNQSFLEGTEGFDLDALALIHTRFE